MKSSQEHLLSRRASPESPLLSYLESLSNPACKCTRYLRTRFLSQPEHYSFLSWDFQHQAMMAQPVLQPNNQVMMSLRLLR